MLIGMNTFCYSSQYTVLEIVLKRKEILRKSTAVWDRSTSWEKLSNLKALHLIKVAKHATAQGIDHEPAFNWWVHHVLKKRT